MNVPAESVKRLAPLHSADDLRTHTHTRTIRTNPIAELLLPSRQHTGRIRKSFVDAPLSRSLHIVCDSRPIYCIQIGAVRSCRVFHRFGCVCVCVCLYVAASASVSIALECASVCECHFFPLHWYALVPFRSHLRSTHGRLTICRLPFHSLRLSS